MKFRQPQAPKLRPSNCTLEGGTKSQPCPQWRNKQRITAKKRARYRLGLACLIAAKSADTSAYSRLHPKPLIVKEGSNMQAHSTCKTKKFKQDYESLHNQQSQSESWHTVNLEPAT